MRTLARPEVEDHNPTALINQPMASAFNVAQFKVGDRGVELHAEDYSVAMMVIEGGISGSMCRFNAIRGRLEAR